MLGDQQILQHGHAGKQPDVLERAGDARLLRDQKIGHALEQKKRAVGSHHAALAAVGQGIERVPHRGIAALQRDAALGRLVEAGDAVEHGGLAGAVRPDQRGDGAALDVEGQIVDGDEAAEAHGQMLDAEHGGAVARGPSAVSLLDQIGGDGLALASGTPRARASRSGRAAARS